MLTDSPGFPPEIIDRLLRETLPLGYIYWDTKGNGLGCSPDVIQLFELTTCQDVFDNWDRLSPAIQPTGDESMPYFEEIMAHVREYGKIVTDWQYQTLRGEPISVEMTCVRHCVHGNEFIIAYLRDQQEPKVIHQDMDTGIANYRFISILRSCPICFAVLSDNRFTFVTPFMHNFLGARVGDLINSIIPDPETAEFLCSEPQEDEMPAWIPVTIQTHYGEMKEMLAYSLFFDESEGTEQIIWLVDITKNRRLEEELKAAKELAETATKAKSEFLATMSHEIRTPMNAIIGLTHIVLRTSLTKQQTEYVGTIQQSAHILLRLINDILDFSKIEAGRMILEYREFSIDSLISGLSAVVGTSIQQKNLELQIEVDENLPSAIMGDSVRLHQVILNLLTNAVKFTEKGTIRLHVEVVESDALSIVIRFSVTDSGIGMTADQINNLFKPFSQAHVSITRQFGGTGLGLAISKQIVKLMHGDISCQSIHGKGTTFTFTARFGIPLEGEITSADESTNIRTNTLLVGDCPSDQSTMRHYIELLGSKVYQVPADLSEFKKILESETIKAVDFIVFDFSDLQKDFVPIYTALLEKRLDPMPVSVITEHPELRTILNELDIKDSVLTLTKPVNAGDLFNIVAKVASHKEETRLKKKTAGGRETSQDDRDFVIPDSIRGAKILLAEDNKVNQMVAKELLRIEGFETTVADNGRIAVELLQQKEFDLVLMDVQMPEMDGLEATRVIRSDKRFQNLPILAMTANAMSGDREISLESGMNDHISKPIDPKILYSALAKWIRKP